MVQDDFVVLPTIQQTVTALESVAESRKAGAAVALRTLGERLISLMCELECELSISQYMRYIKVTCTASGNYELEIDDYNCGVDTEELQREIEAAMNPSGFDKPLRPVQIKETPEPTHAPDPNPVPGAAEGSAGLPAAEVGSA